MSGKDVFNQQNYVAAIGMDREAQLIGALAKDGILHFLGVSQLQNLVRGAHRPGLPDREVKLFGQVVQRHLVGLTDRRRKFIRHVARPVCRPSRAPLERGSSLLFRRTVLV